MVNKFYIIYKYTNIINGKIYVGVTNRGIKTRRYEHILGSRKNPKFKFHQAIKKYGINSFKEEILVENVMTRDEANKLEIYYISIFDSYKNGYNMTQGGGNRGEFKHTNQSREKMSKSHLGKKLSNEHSNNISNSLRGKSKSIEHRLNVINAITGLKRSEVEKIKMSNRMKGKFVKDKNPAAIKINIYDSNKNLKFFCNGDFEYVCKQNGLPTKALRKSYYNNGKPIYGSKTIKKEVLIANKEFIGWFAIKQS